MKVKKYIFLAVLTILFIISAMPAYAYEAIGEDGQHVVIGDQRTKSDNDGGNAVVIGPSVENNGSNNVVIGSANEDSGDSGNPSTYPHTSVKGHGSIAIGDGNTHVTGDRSIAFGSQATATRDYSTAIGAHSSSTASYSVALGYNSQATEEYTVSIGNVSSSLTRRLVNMSAGLNDTDAVNVSQLKKLGTDVSSALGGTSSCAFSSADGTGKLTAGLSVSGQTYTTVQDALNATNTNITNLQSTVDSLDLSVVKYDSGGSDKSNVTFEGEHGTQLHNVADGVADKDAVNKGQLDKAVEETLANANAKSKWSLKVNDGAAEQISDGKTVALREGKNVKITKNPDGTYVFNVADNPAFDSLTINSSSITASVWYNYQRERESLYLNYFL